MKKAQSRETATPNVETTTAKKRGENRTKAQAQAIVAQAVIGMKDTPSKSRHKKQAQADELQQIMEARFGLEHDEHTRKHKKRADEMNKGYRGDTADEEYRETQQSNRNRYDPERDVWRTDDRTEATKNGETTEPHDEDLADQDKKREEHEARVNNRARVQREREYRGAEERVYHKQEENQEEHDRKMEYMNNNRRG
jgi:hypothetical protein